MNKQGWLTRTADPIGGEGQNAATLAAPQPSATPPRVGEPASLATGATR